jgi:hypothetical protein
MPVIVFHTDAAEEMRAAAASYEGRERGLGERFLDEVEQGLQRIQQFTQLWPSYEGAYRRYLLKRFPYGLSLYIGEILGARQFMHCDTITCEHCQQTRLKENPGR